MLKIASSLRRPLLAACLLAALGAAAAADLRIGFRSEITAADPHVHQIQNRNVWMHVYEPLVMQDDKLRAVPGLARGWRPTDELTWEFKLRPNVVFHDGSAFSAEDAKFSIERAMALTGPRTLKGYLKDIEAVKVVDALTLQVKTRTPTPALPDDLSLVPIVARSVGSKVTEENFASGAAAIGTGPYKFAEWSRGQRVVLVRNDKYWGAREPWDKVIFEFIPKDPARASALLSGSVDVIDGASAGVMEALRRSDKTDRASITSYMLNYLFMDTFRPNSPYVKDASGKPMAANPFMNLKVRQAISYAINREAIIQHVMKGDAEATGQIVPPGFFGHDPSIRPGAYDAARAKALLAEAGYPQGFHMTLHCTNDRYLNDAKVCEAIGQMLTAVGIKAEVQSLPFAVLQPRAISGGPKGEPEFSAVVQGIGAVTGDSLQPLIAVTQSYDKQAGTGMNNYGRYSNKQLDTLITQAGRTISAHEREDLQRKAAHLIADDLPVIPLHHIKASWAFRKGLTVAPRMDGFTYATAIREAGAK